MHRLKTRPQFQAVLAGQMLAKTTHFALHCCAVADASVVVDGGAPVALFPVPGVWLGAMVPKRWAKRAVTRSAIKRQIYQVGLGVESALLERAHLVRLRSAFDRKHFVSASSDVLKTAVREELQLLFSRAQSSSTAFLSVPAVVGVAR